MRISIVTPSYNQAQFLEQTINSVLSQGYDDLEYIIIDGGSTDGSRDIIKKYSSYLKFWCSEKDNGQSAAINKGFSYASGEILGWINSDDFLEPNCLLTVAKYFRQNREWQALIGACNLLYCDSKGEIIRRDTRQPPACGNQAVYNWKSEWFSQQSTFWRRSLWERAGNLREDLHYTMDLELWQRFAAHTTLHSIPATLSNYRFHESAKCISQNMAATIEEFNLNAAKLNSPDHIAVRALKNQVENLAREIVDLRNQLQQVSKDRDDAVAIQAMQNEEICAIRRSKLYRVCRTITRFSKRRK